MWECAKSIETPAEEAAMMVQANLVNNQFDAQSGSGDVSFFFPVCF